MSRVLNPKQTAEIMKCSRQTVIDRAAAGRMPEPVDQPRGRGWREADIKSFVNTYHCDVESWKRDLEHVAFATTCMEIAAANGVEGGEVHTLAQRLARSAVRALNDVAVPLKFRQQLADVLLAADWQRINRPNPDPQLVEAVRTSIAGLDSFNEPGND